MRNTKWVSNFSSSQLVWIFFLVCRWPSLKYSEPSVLLNTLLFHWYQMVIDAPSTLSVVAHKCKARAGSSNLTVRLRPWPSWVFLPPMCEQTCSPLLRMPVRWHHCPVCSHQRPQQGRPSSCDLSVSLPPTYRGWILISSPTWTLIKRPAAFLKGYSHRSWSSWSSSTLFLKKQRR